MEKIINKINVDEYLENKELLELKYIPFDVKYEIISTLITGFIKIVGGINSALLKRIVIETIIENVTNIDLTSVSETGLKGYDQLCYKNELNNLIDLIGNEYKIFYSMYEDYVSDYIRSENNPSFAISNIYGEIKEGIKYIIEHPDLLGDVLNPINEEVGDINER